MNILLLFDIDVLPLVPSGEEKRVLRRMSWGKHFSSVRHKSVVIGDEGGL